MIEPSPRYQFQGDPVRLIGKSHFKRQNGSLVFENELTGGVYVLEPNDPRLKRVLEDLYLKVSWPKHHGIPRFLYVKVCPEAVQRHKISNGVILVGMLNPNGARSGMPELFLVEEVLAEDGLPPNHPVFSNILLYSIPLTPLPCLP